jgi:phage gpG-like protein
MGNYGGFDRITRLLKVFESSEFKRELSQNLAEEAVLQVAMGFRKAESPYGAAWAPHAASRFASKRSPGRILRSSGVLANSITSGDVSASGFRIGTGVKYAAVHQFGHQFAARQQAAVRVKPGQIMFVRQDSQWGEEMGPKRWSKLLRKFGVRTGKKAGAMPGTIGQVSRIFMVTVAPKIPARPFLPTNGLPERWRSRFRAIYKRLLQEKLDAN